MDFDEDDFNSQLAILNEIEAGKDVHRECRRNGGNGTLHSETENSFFEINDEVSLDHPAKRRKTSCSEPHCNYEPSNFLGSRIPISGDYVPITFPDGRRRYLRVESEVDDGSVVDSSTSGLNSYKSLLPYDLCRLVQNAENLGKNKCGLRDFELPLTHSVDDLLWVKKYEPTSYLDLLSAEHINRQLLCWLKAWDYSVFGVESKTLSPPKQPPFPFDNFAGNYDNNQQSFHKHENEVTIAQLDLNDGRRPHYRIVLLSGPPGLGKTTLAHLLARKAGYQVIEANASDDRSPSTMRDLLEAVASSQTSLNTSDGEAALKPSCLIIDEIDGALPAAVDVLAEAAASPLLQERKRGKKKSIVLRRPVICICNDLYAPSLRSLRAPGAFCFILRLPPIDANRLIDRLDSIARSEELSVDKRFLSILVESSGRDIRSCLNLLQFSKATQVHQKRALTTQELMTGLESSMAKDTQHSLFSAWKSVFTIPPAHVITHRVNHTSLLHSKHRQDASHGSDSALRARIQITMEICDSTGDVPNLILGLFENYLTRKMKDASLQKASSASEWIVYSDILLHHVQTAQDYSLMRYAALLPAWFHLAFASTMRPPPAETRWAREKNSITDALRWPTALTESTTAAGRTIAVLDSVLENQWRAGGLSSSQTSFRLLTRRQFLLDVASYLIRIVCALSLPLRPVNAQLYNTQEKQHLARLVDLMISAGLDWVPQQSHDTGDATYRLEPPLDDLAQFVSTTLKMPNLDSLPYAVKQMLARELATERMRRADVSNGPILGAGKDPISVPRPQTIGFGATITRGRRKPTPLSDSFMAARLAPMAAPLNITVEKKVRRDFFGRPIIDKSDKPELKENEQPTVHCPINETIWFKFKEGHSNAVRRPFSMTHFIK